MPEGDIHRELVKRLAHIISERRANAFQIFVDNMETFGSGALPPFIGECRPDIYALENQTRHVVIGEAKTAGDVDNPHTTKQLRTYFEHIATYASGELILSVPLIAAGASYRLCIHARKVAGAPYVPFEVIGWLLGPKPFSQVWRG